MRDALNHNDGVSEKYQIKRDTDIVELTISISVPSKNFITTSSL